MGIVIKIRERIRRAENENKKLKADLAQARQDNEDLTVALLELGEMCAAQDDAIVELAELISE